MINHRLLFLFQWKYMRENLFNVTTQHPYRKLLVNKA